MQKSGKKKKIFNEVNIKRLIITKIYPCSHFFAGFATFFTAIGKHTSDLTTFTGFADFVML